MDNKTVYKSEHQIEILNINYPFDPYVNVK